MCQLCFRFPFDWNKPIGYLIAVALECAVVLIATLIAICIIAPVFGSIFMLISVAKSLKDFVTSIREKANHKKARVQSMKQISDFIELQSNAIKLNEILLDIFLQI